MLLCPTSAGDRNVGGRNRSDGGGAGIELNYGSAEDGGRVVASASVAEGSCYGECGGEEEEEEERSKSCEEEEVSEEEKRKKSEIVSRGPINVCPQQKNFLSVCLLRLCH